MIDDDPPASGLTRRGLIVGAVAAAGLAASGRAASAEPGQDTASAPAAGETGSFAGHIPRYQTSIPGESIEVDRVDVPVAPGIVLTSFSTFGRAGWLRVHVLNAELGNGSVSVDLVADKVSDPRTLSRAAD